MSEWIGIIHRQELAGVTTWTLQTDSGSVQVQGAVPAELDGERVRVRGREAAQQFGFAMAGTVVQADRIDRSR